MTAVGIAHTRVVDDCNAYSGGVHLHATWWTSSLTAETDNGT